MTMGELLQAEDPDSISNNRDIGYKGRIGSLRRDFCVNYINQKHAVFARIRQEIVRKKNTFTCQKGCSICCVLYIEADIRECEAIVYYLYIHDDVLASFLRRYPDWRRKTGRYGDILMNCVNAWRTLREDKGRGDTEAKRLEAAEALLDYGSLNVPCVFLENDLCTIYEVRPYVCAAHFASTPAEWCSPLHEYEPTIYRAEVGKASDDLSFYYGEFEEPVVSCMPLAVYGILDGDYEYISRVTGLRRLVEEAKRNF